jgi:hypothetical protein
MRSWRFLTLSLTALSMGMAVSHVLAMPAKFAYQGPVCLLQQQTLNGNFRMLGALVELGAAACALVLTFLVRARTPALGWTIFGTICLVGAQAAWWVGIAPLNTAIAGLTPHTLPADWAQLRVHWEYTHLLRAVLYLAAFSALLFSVLAETPRRGARLSRA